MCNILPDLPRSSFILHNSFTTLLLLICHPSPSFYSRYSQEVKQNTSLAVLYKKKKTYLLSVTSCQNSSSSQLLASLTSLPRFSKTSTTSFPSSSVLQQLTFSLFLHRTEVPNPHLPGSASSALASHSFSLHHLPDDRLYFTEILFPYRRKKPSQHQSLVGFCSFFFFSSTVLCDESVMGFSVGKRFLMGSHLQKHRAVTPPALPARLLRRPYVQVPRASWMTQCPTVGISNSQQNRVKAFRVQVHVNSESKHNKNKCLFSPRIKSEGFTGRTF